MIAGYSADQIRDAEASEPDLLESGELMQRAAKGVAKVARARLWERGASRVVALVGPGNNGADALWAISRLAKKGFVASAVVHDTSVNEGQRAAEAAALARGARVIDGTSPDALDAIAGAEVVLDGITGLGGRPGLPPFAEHWVDAIYAGAYVIAVDTPSGQPVGGGEVRGDAVFADETVTFIAPKPVHLLPPTAAAAGLLTVVDIGVAPTGTPDLASLTPDDVPDLWPVPGPGDDKYRRGVLGVVAGGEQYTGAALLSTTAAVSAGAGMVRYVGTPTPESLVRSSVPEVVHGPGRVQAWVIGPGLDPSSRAKGAKAQLDVARDALASDLPVLLDAGGLDLLRDRREAPTLLTPHAGEAARMLGRLTGREVPREEVERDPAGAARELAGETGATVLLKGASTVLVPPEGQVLVQSTAPSWLATAGTGDVLAGVVGVLLASGLEPSLAGALGTLVHGEAARDANPGGPVRALAVAEEVGPAVARLLAASPR
ncbi:bifunctional ADP-dependent NAD(P)H-hydrate dehydratase/NAD(P)H-hydrate epimerase [Marihabitans asiaticum]|uniref:ADP-dependent (S)-NAD(P)H-hydrate dehydratase n=1 Tax=Marihabitans asiaticum TaxID=415218 RepID=A0A560WDG1_9MICO|nr:NAD(P)H-hydrate dehydratase [Marihabitans asiaticum]TWD15574.1 hydroxyethylthiazole kinase-like uncharacterized protein yjeF/hydroxyethylthiazole kinase-like uncharacterized protein yjeF [Marihabitans asiaticum]